MVSCLKWVRGVEMHFVAFMWIECGNDLYKYLFDHENAIFYSFIIPPFNNFSPISIYSQTSALLQVSFLYQVHQLLSTYVSECEDIDAIV